MSKLYILSGPSGVGKGSIIEALVEDKELNLNWLKTVTTREKRLDDDKYGRHIFMSVDDFKTGVAEKKFAEHNFYNGNYYGTLKSSIEETIAEKNPHIMEIDVNGSTNLKKLYPDNIVQIFIYADFNDIRKRLQLRGMPDNLIEQRLSIAREEMEKSKDFEYLIENKQNKLNDAVNSIKNIILASGENRNK